MTEESVVYDFNEVMQRCTQALERVGVETRDAEDTAHSLVLADSRGLGSHGVSKLPLYVGRIQREKMEPQTRVDIVRERASSLLLDGNNGIGIPVGLRAMELVTQKALETGIAFATVRRSNHFGMAGFIAERANRSGLIGYAASNGPARMPAYGARNPVFGTSPFACAVPTGGSGPIIVDMATCVVARGKIRMAAQTGDTIPEGWALDENGQPTTDPHSALAGSVVPFAGPKGSAIALLIEIFSGVLGGLAWGRKIQDHHKQDVGASGISHSLMAVDIEAFAERHEFEANLADLVTQIKDDPVSSDSPVYLPGEREHMLHNDAVASGFTIPAVVVKEVNSVLRSLKVRPIEPKTHQGVPFA